MDIVSSFPSIDSVKNVQNICFEIDKKENFNNSIKTSLKSELNLILYSNVFIFDNRFCRQSQGAPMGSLISDLQAEFKLLCMENLIRNSFDLKPSDWLRYVEDIFITWNYVNEPFSSFFQRPMELIITLNLLCKLKNTRHYHS